MVLVDQIQEPTQELGALLLGQTVDMLDMAANREDALPARDGIGAHDGVDGLQLATDVLGRAPRFVVELKPCVFRHLTEKRLLKGGGEAFKELLVWFADAVINLVARSPQSVCTGNVSTVTV